MSALFLPLLRQHGIPAPIAEHRFHPTRKWRWDYAWPAAKVALEVDGGLFIGGKHARGAGILKDQEKRNAGATLGWRLLVVRPSTLASLDTVRLIQAALDLEVAA
ncbi:MAG TPA: hypothetical protein PKA66_07375 [Gemmatimonadales bacterium]|nr:hypothetical protein [Gemmatimonadales bacterium]